MSAGNGSPYVGIVDRIIAAAQGPNGVRFVGPSVAPASGDSFVPWSEIHDDARVVGAALQARGLVPGDHVAILGPTSRNLITIIQGCWLAGIASMVLPLPMRMGSLDAFIDSTRARIRHGDAKLVLIDELLAAFYDRTIGDPPLEPMSAVLSGASTAPSGERLEIPSHDPERLVILQYTSGSTSEPKGVMIPDRVLAANIDACCLAAAMGDHEVMVSWLPLYHDMGLVGFLSIPMTAGCQLVQAAPQDFLAKPGSWMQWISDWGGTVTAGPNFSWVLATRALTRMSCALANRWPSGGRRRTNAAPSTPTTRYVRFECPPAITSNENGPRTPGTWPSNHAVTGAMSMPGTSFMLLVRYPGIVRSWPSMSPTQRSRPR